MFGRCALLVALVDARDYQKPKLQQRARSFFAALCESVPAPLSNSKLMALPTLATSDDTVADRRARSERNKTSRQTPL